jgi:chromosome segregation ATPase
MKALNKLWSDMSARQELEQHREKQELASQEVKLSAIERLESMIADMRNVAGEIQTSVNDFDQHMDRAYQAYRDMEEESMNASYGMNELDEEIAFVEKAGEELGIDVPAVKVGRKVMQDVEEAYGQAEERIRKFNL